MKAFDANSVHRAETYIAVAPAGMDPCDLRKGEDETAVGPGRAPAAAVRVRGPDEPARARPRRGGGPGRALRERPAGRQDQGRVPRDGYAPQLAGWAGWQDEVAAVRRVRESAGEPAKRPGGAAGHRRSRPGGGRASATTCGCGSARRSRPCCRTRDGRAGVRHVAREAFTHPATASCTRRCWGPAGCRPARGPAGSSPWQPRVHTYPRGLVTELAVEPLGPDHKGPGRALRRQPARRRAAASWASRSRS